MKGNAARDVIGTNCVTGRLCKPHSNWAVEYKKGQIQVQ